MAKGYDNQYKISAVRYYRAHKDLGIKSCAEHMGISRQTLYHWLKEQQDPSLDKEEIARLRQELQNTKETLDILKKAINLIADK